MNRPKLQNDGPSGASKTKVQYSGSFLAKIVVAVRRHKPIYLIAAFMQVMFGLLVVGLSMVGLVQPIWVAAIVNVLGCISVMTGGYQLYDMLRHNNGPKGLISDAMHDAVNFRN